MNTNLLIQQIWDVFVLSLILAAIGVAVLVVRIHPNRLLNRLLAAFLLAVSLSQGSQLLWLNSRHLYFLRTAHVLTGGALVAAGLIRDTVFHPTSALRRRIKREVIFLGPALAIVIFPLTHWWVLDHNASSLNSLRPIFLLYLCLRAALALHLVISGVYGAQKLPANRRFDALTFCTLSFFLLIGIVLALLVRLSLHYQALRWVEILVGAYYPLVVWMMTSTRELNLVELGHRFLKPLLCVAIPLGVVLPVSMITLHPLTVYVALLLSASTCLFILIGKISSGAILRLFHASPQDRARAEVISLIENEWSEKLFRESFCSIVSSLMGGVQVDLVALESDTNPKLSPSQEVLVQAATATGSLTIHSMMGRTASAEANRILEAFAAEDTALVLISQHLGSKSALFIGQLSSLKIIPLPLTAFLVDLLAFYHIGRHRIQSAHKAFDVIPEIRAA